MFLIFWRHLKVHSYYGGLGGLQLPLMRVRATRQHGNRRGRPARSGFGLQEDPTRFKTDKAPGLLDRRIFLGTRGMEGLQGQCRGRAQMPWSEARGSER
jgi:hypothetical protein